MDLGEFFKSVRKYQGVKQQSVAKEVGVTHVALSRFESGRSKLSHETLSKIATVLNINPRFIMDSSINPFLSNRLLKMYLSTEFMEMKDALLTILSVMIHSQISEMYFLIPPVSILDRVVRLDISQEVPVYAVTCKDRDGNMYLFRRKAKSEFILKRKELVRNINGMLHMLSHVKGELKRAPISYKVRKIDGILYEKIKKWSVEKEDLIFLFEPEDKAKKLYEYVLSINASGSDVEKVLKLLQQSQS